MATDPAATPAYLLFCSACGRSEGQTVAEVLAHTRGGWPKCCGQVMAYLTSAERPSTGGDTALDKPALSDDTSLDKPLLPE